MAAHRFRHTLTTEILVNGGSMEDAANILGDSPEIIRKHYAKWSIAYQRRTVELFSKIHGIPLDCGTPWARGKNTPIKPADSTLIVVPGVGLERARNIERV